MIYSYTSSKHVNKMSPRAVVWRPLLQIENIKKILVTCIVSALYTSALCIAFEQRNVLKFNQIYRPG